MLAPAVLVGAPLVAIVLNLLAITHLELSKTRREAIVTLKLRPLNVAIVIIAAFVIAVVFAHSVSHPR